MNKEANAILKEIIVNEVSIKVDPDKIRKGDITLSAEGKSELRVPKEDDDTSILLVSSMEIKSPEDTELFHASFVANFFFLIDEKLENYDNIVTKQCLPVIQEELNKLASKILSEMGFPGILKVDK